MRKAKICSLIMAGVLSLSMAIGSTQAMAIEGRQAVVAGERSVNSTFISQSSYDSAMKNTVEPYIDSKKETGYLDVEQPNFKIYYEKYKVENAKGNIVLSHGFSESLEKYHEMIYYFMNEGYSVYGLEHRGHGRSGHLGTEDPTQINVGNFEDYVSDFQVFLDKIVKPETRNEKLFLFAHSMGGGIGARFLEQHSGYFDAAILSSPMMEVNVAGLPENLALLLSSAAKLPWPDKFVVTQGAYKPDYNFAEAATTCEERYAYSHNIINSNPEIQRGGTSYRWLQSAIAATINIRTDAKNVKTPVLLFQAEKDTFVKAGGQDEFANTAKNYCTKVTVPGAKHEIFMEKDEILKPYLEKVMSFYNQH